MKTAHSSKSAHAPGSGPHPKGRAGLLLLLVLALAGAARLADLGSRPMHADEAVQAYIFAGLLEHGEYRYDPSHYHGPLPHFINLPLMRAMGVRFLDALQAWQFRLQPALAGLLLVALAGACAGNDARARRRAMLLAAVSPMLVYFSRMAIHETLLAVCALGVPFAVSRWLLTRRMPWLLLAAAAFGCMHATKETWCIVAFGWAVAAAVLWPRRMWRAVRSAGVWRIALALGVAMGISFLLYSDFGKHPEGFADAWRTLFAYRTGGGHEKGWWYYLAQCFGIWPAGEGVIALLALAGGAMLWRRRKNRRDGHAVPGLPVFLAVSGAAQLVVYSMIKYKTPWLALAPLVSFVPLAAHGWLWLQGRAAGFSLRTAALALAVAAGLAAPMFWSCFKQPEHAGIPYVYAPTLPEADAELARVAADLPPDAMVAVIGGDYWPLPWYFRARRERTGYFSEAGAPSAAELREFALVIRAGYQLDPAATGKGWRVLELRPGYFASVSR